MIIHAFGKLFGLHNTDNNLQQCHNKHIILILYKKINQIRKDNKD